MGEYFQPCIYAEGRYTVKLSKHKPEARTLAGLTAKPKAESESIEVQL